MAEPATLRILLVEDDEFDVAVFNRAFRQAGVACEVVRCRSGEEALDGLHDAELDLDLLVTDHQLPGRSGFDLCLELIEGYRGSSAGGSAPPFALVLLTGVGSEQMAIRALRAGINDYIVKDSSQEYLELLPLVLPRVARRHRQRRLRQQAAQEPEGDLWTAEGGGGGLAAAADVVRQRGGRVWVEGAGGPSPALCFRVALAPDEAAYWTAADRTAGGEPEPTGPAGDEPGGIRDGVRTDRGPVADDARHVLVVHPNPIVTFVARLAIEAAGCRFAAAESGAKAIETFELEPFDLVLIALDMPGLDGFETARRIRAREGSPNGRVTLLALGADADAEERCLQSGFDGTVATPVSVRRLRATIDDLG